MGQRFDTDGGTAFAAPLSLVDQDGNVVATFDGAAIAALTDVSVGVIDDSANAGSADVADVQAALDALEAAVNAIIAAVQS